MNRNLDFKNDKIKVFITPITVTTRTSRIKKKCAMPIKLYEIDKDPKRAEKNIIGNLINRISLND